MSTEQEVVRDALESPPDFEPAPLHLGPIMAAGARVRRRRRFAVSAASFVAVVGLLVAGDQLINGFGGPSGATGATGQPAPSGPAPSGPAPSGPAPSGPAPSGGGPSDPIPSAVDSSAPGILGRVVETGQRLNGQRWILYVETVDPDDIDHNLTLVLGRTTTGYIDDFTTDVVGQDTGGGRMSPGFHAVEPGTIVDGRTTPTFGYYAGDAARITARDTRTGTQVEAHLAAWSGFGQHDKAQIFWFDVTQGQSPMTLTGLTAYDRKGAELPS
jgi:hypothetical protein